MQMPATNTHRKSGQPVMKWWLKRLEEFVSNRQSRVKSHFRP